ncbi:MAG: DNA polymerase III subunit alpha [Bdellovibrionota bacterium]
MSFVHLHVHSHYSLLKGMLTIDEMIERAKSEGMPAIALTDLGNMYATLEFYQKATKAGIKPIFGLDTTITFGDRKERSTQAPSYQIVLLAKDQTGLENLFQLVTIANVEGFYYKPRIDRESLRKHRQGLIGLSGTHFGLISKPLLEGREDAAKAQLDEFQEIFGRENFYVELVDHGLDVHKTLRPKLIEFARKYDAPLVVTNDCHYLNREDSKAHDVLLCIGNGKFLHEDNRLKFHSEEYYLKSAEEMTEKFYDVADGLENTLTIASQCDVTFDLKNYHMPQYQVPEGKSLDQVLAEQSREGLEDRLRYILTENVDDTKKSEIRAQYVQRLEQELSIICSMGFSGYFLIVADFINYAKKRNIPVGPGRGSAAGSLVAFATNITDIDPIPYDLLFERFLNPERISMPDIDVDFCQDGRDQVITYVSEKYDGDRSLEQTRVAQICTFGKLQARAAIRDVGRVLGIPYGEVDKIAKLVPTILNISLDDAFSQEPKFNELRKEDEQIDEMLTIARRIEGLCRHASVHAAGVVISDQDPLVHHLPMMKGQEDEIVTQWDMKAVEKVGLVKFDFLGLKTLTLLAKACELIKKSQGVEVDILHLNMQDEKVFSLLGRGETQGVFQLESSGMRDLVVRLKPNCFEDIVALVALYRPGPLGSGMVDDFISRKHGKTKIVYDLPQLEDILKETYGVILYQEQVMQIASTLASYSLGEADLLRRAMGKKIKEEMDQQQQRFLEGAEKNQIPKDKSEKIFDLMAKFAGYGFNKSHSAAYAMISYQTAYLKAHYPVEFMAACLSIDRNNTDRVVSHLADCRNQNIEVLHPDINESDLDFRVEQQRIRFGLAAIKNVGENAITSMVSARQEGGKFSSLSDLCMRVELRQVNKKVLEALVKSGSMDSLHNNRAQLFGSIPKALEFASRDQKDRAVGQDSLFGSSSVTEFVYEDVEEWDDAEKLGFEKDSVGFYISGHPLLKYEMILDNYTSANTSNLMEKKNQSTQRLGGTIASIKEITTKKGDRMAFATLEDLYGSVELVIFPKVYQEFSELFKSDEPLFVKGKLDLAEDQAKILVDAATRLKHAAKLFQGNVHVYFDLTQADAQRLDQLKVALKKHTGDCPMLLHCQVPGKTETVISLPSEYRVIPTSELFDEVSGILGDTTKIQLR